MRLRIELRDGVRQLGHRGLDGLPGEVRHLGDVVGKHEIDRSRVKDLDAGVRGSAIVQQRRDYLGVFLRLRETASTAGIEDPVATAVVQGSALDMPARLDLTIGIALVHVY